MMMTSPVTRTRRMNFIVTSRWYLDLNHWSTLVTSAASIERQPQASCTVETLLHQNRLVRLQGLW